MVGNDSFPSLNDRPNMPYLQSIIHEVHRISALGFTGIPRKVTEDVKLGGYDIPKNTHVMTHYYAVLHDKEYWGDPEVFRPERFIKDGKFASDEHDIAFGFGKRMCIGKMLAQNELFIFVGGLVQKFHFKLPEGKPIPNMDPVPGFVLGCPAYEVVSTSRK